VALPYMKVGSNVGVAVGNDEGVALGAGVALPDT